MLKTPVAVASVVLDTETHLQVLWNVNVVCLFRICLTNYVAKKGEIRDYDNFPVEFY